MMFVNVWGGNVAVGSWVCGPITVIVEVDVTEVCVAILVAVDVFVVAAVFCSRGTGTDQSLTLGTHYIAACVTVVKAISVAGV